MKFSEKTFVAYLRRYVAAMEAHDEQLVPVELPMWLDDVRSFIEIIEESEEEE
jgi:hypothetical protein|tara:strand:+ start:407 stop:565 length:159 start_codon:yes stop_codon:yes gene_type:complete